jgi:hypothetical protein
VRFEVPAAVRLNKAMFLDFTVISMAGVYRHFETIYYLHFQGRNTMLSAGFFGLFIGPEDGLYVSQRFKC